MGLRFRLEEAETKFSGLTDEDELSRFKLRAKEEVKAELRRELEAKA